MSYINDMIVGIENRDGNTNVRFNQRETLERIFKRLEASEVYISRARMDCGYQKLLQSYYAEIENP